VPTIAIEPITTANMLLFKDVRLRALQDTPYAFGSTYAKESQFTELEWIKRVERWNGESGTGFLAMDQGTACGIAGSLLTRMMRRAPSSSPCGQLRHIVSGGSGVYW